LQACAAFRYRQAEAWEFASGPPERARQALALGPHLRRLRYLFPLAVLCRQGPSGWRWHLWRKLRLRHWPPELRLRLPLRQRKPAGSHRLLRRMIQHPHRLLRRLPVFQLRPLHLWFWALFQKKKAGLRLRLQRRVLPRRLLRHYLRLHFQHLRYPRPEYLHPHYQHPEYQRPEYQRLE
jgi:hypothetical protein